MSINEAVLLILDSAILARGGEIFVTKMPVIYIRVLAEVMIRELSPEYGFANGAIEIVEVGIKPGEKLYEELMTRAEAERAIELEKYFVILPEFDSKEENYIKSYPNLVSQQVSEEYTSVNSAVLDAEDLMRFLKKNNLFKR
jgi:FlaA1/EpsC-like NDP-sugar epimerase